MHSLNLLEGAADIVPPDWTIALIFAAIMTILVLWLLPRRQKRRPVPVWDSNQIGGRLKVINGMSYPVKAGYSRTQIHEEGMPQCEHWGPTYISIIDAATDGSWEIISCNGCGRLTVALGDGIVEAKVPHPVTGQMCWVELFPHPDKFREEGLHAPDCLVC